MTHDTTTDLSLCNQVAFDAAEPKQLKLKGALLFVSWGLRVFPAYSIENGVCTCSAASACSSPGKHPRTAHGLKDATDDPEQIKEWWARWPNANVGVATDGLCVVDEDEGKGKSGAESLRALEEKYGAFPQTLTVQTGSGGRHIYLRGNAPCSQSKVGKNIDIRGDGGYVIAPPSDHVSGRSYELIAIAEGADPIAQAPEWLVTAANAKTRRLAGGPIDAEFELKPEHCLQQAKALARRTSVRDQQHRQWWLDIANGVQLCERGRKQAHALVLPVTTMIAEAFPGASSESVCKLLLPTWPEGDQPEVVNAFVGWRDKVLAEREEHETKLVTYEAAGLALGDEGKVLPTPANIAKIARMPGKGLAGCLRINVRGQLLECRALPWAPSARWREWNDTDDMQLAEWLQDQWEIYVGPERLRSPIATAAALNEVDPFVEWLRSLPMWDGVSRSNAWLTRVFGGEHSVYTRAVSRKFLLSIVARAENPGCKVDTKLVLCGPQGYLKSSALETLVGAEFFSNAASDPAESTKDRLARLHRCVLIEDQEMATYTRADVNADKAFLSTRIDMFRPPYGRSTGSYPRRFVLAGTSNEAEGFLRDVTGGRRYWPFKCEHRADLEWLRTNRDQLWAEVMHVWSDESLRVWWLAGEEEAAAEFVQEDHRQSVPYEDSLRERLADPDVIASCGYVLARVHNSVRDGQIQALTTGAALALLGIDRERQEQEKAKVGRAMRALGFKPRGQTKPRRYVTRGYVSDPPPPSVN